MTLRPIPALLMAFALACSGGGDNDTRASGDGGALDAGEQDADTETPCAAPTLPPESCGGREFFARALALSENDGLDGVGEVADIVEVDGGVRLEIHLDSGHRPSLDLPAVPVGVSEGARVELSGAALRDLATDRVVARVGVPEMRDGAPPESTSFAGLTLRFEPACGDRVEHFNEPRSCPDIAVTGYAVHQGDVSVLPGELGRLPLGSGEELVVANASVWRQTGDFECPYCMNAPFRGDVLGLVIVSD